MPISHKYKIIFIHIPKTGGSSIDKTFGMYGNNNTIDKNILFGNDIQHYTIMDLLNNRLISTEEYKEYFKFAFVRNPWDKMVSEYFYRKRWDNIVKKMKFKDFITFFLKFENDSGSHFRNQYEFISNKNDEIMVDYIGKYENLQNEINYICELIGAPPMALPMINNTRHLHYSYYYTKSTKNIVKERYKDDIKKFNYFFQKINPFYNIKKKYFYIEYDFKNNFKKRYPYLTKIYRSIKSVLNIT